MRMVGCGVLSGPGNAEEVELAVRMRSRLLGTFGLGNGVTTTRSRSFGKKEIVQLSIIRYGRNQSLL